MGGGWPHSVATVDEGERVFFVPLFRFSLSRSSGAFTLEQKNRLFGVFLFSSCRRTRDRSLVRKSSFGALFFSSRRGTRDRSLVRKIVAFCVFLFSSCRQNSRSFTLERNPVFGYFSFSSCRKTRDRSRPSKIVSFQVFLLFVASRTRDGSRLSRIVFWFSSLFESRVFVAISSPSRKL